MIKRYWVVREADGTTVDHEGPIVAADQLAAGREYIAKTGDRGCDGRVIQVGHYKDGKSNVRMTVGARRYEVIHNAQGKQLKRLK